MTSLTSRDQQLCRITSKIFESTPKILSMPCYVMPTEAPLGLKPSSWVCAIFLLGRCLDPSDELVKDAMLISISLITAEFRERVIKLFFNNTYYFNTMLVTLPKHCLNDCKTRASRTTLFRH